MSEASLSRVLDRSNHGAIRSDRLAFVLAAGAVFLSPYNVLRHSIVYFTAADLMAVLAILVLIGSGRLPLAPFSQLTPIWYTGFITITGGMVIGGIANQRLVTSLDVIVQYTFAMLILPWALCGRNFTQTRRLLLVFGASMFTIMLHGIYLITFASDPPLNLVSGSGRLQGVVERENELAALGAMAVVVTMYLTAERILPFILSATFIATLLYGIVLTASNTGVLTTVSGFVAFTLLQRSSRHFVLIGLLCGLLLIAFRIGGDSLMPQSFTNRVAGALTSGDLEQAGTFGDRLELIREGWKLSEDHVLIGLGAEGYRVISPHHAPVHNTYVLLLVEGGVLSLFGLCAIIIMPLLSGATLLTSSGTRNSGALVVAVMVQYALALSAFPHIYARFYFVPLVLVTSLAVVSRAAEQTEMAATGIGQNGAS